MKSGKEMPVYKLLRSAAARRCLVALSLAASGLVVPALADDDFPGVRRLMSDEEFRKTGLDGLTEQELEALDAWLLRYTAGDAEILRETSDKVREAREDHEVVSRIVGDFEGWSGGTVFRLENGQVWEQRLDGRYRYRGEPNPEVRIDRNWLGFYRLTVIESGRSVGVSPRLDD
jgi:hypothetical protein